MKLSVCLTSGGIIVAINSVIKATTIRNEMAVASLREPRLFPGILTANQWTGEFKARAKKKAVNTSTSAWEAFLAANIIIKDTMTRSIILIIVRLETVTSVLLV